MYITERAVFKLTSEGVELIEIAPGIDVQEDVLDRMGFVPQMVVTPAKMHAALFYDDGA